MFSIDLLRRELSSRTLNSLEMYDLMMNVKIWNPNSIYGISNSDLTTPHHTLNMTASLSLSVNTNELLNVKNENSKKMYSVAWNMWKSWTAVVRASIGDFGSLYKSFLALVTPAPGAGVINAKKLLPKSFLAESMAVIGWC